MIAELLGWKMRKTKCADLILSPNKNKIKQGFKKNMKLTRNLQIKTCHNGCERLNKHGKHKVYSDIEFLQQCHNEQRPRKRG